MASTKNKSGTWLVTYSDLVTLLLVFFVLLYVMTPGVDEARFSNMLSFFQQSTGILDGRSIESQRLRSEEVQRIVEQWEVLERMVNRQGLGGDISVETTGWGVRVILQDRLAFESGSDRLLSGAELVIGRVATMIDEEVTRIRVEGHTDNVPLLPGSRFRSNWHLGAARAVSVLDALQAVSEMDPSRMEAVSHGEFQPVASNESADGRSANRRVEIHLSYQDWLYQPDPIFELESEFPSVRR